jgi:hypothetical protein
MPPDDTAEPGADPEDEYDEEGGWVDDDELFLDPESSRVRRAVHRARLKELHPLATTTKSPWATTYLTFLLLKELLDGLETDKYNEALYDLKQEVEDNCSLARDSLMSRPHVAEKARIARLEGYTLEQLKTLSLLDQHLQDAYEHIPEVFRGEGRRARPRAMKAGHTTAS